MTGSCNRILRLQVYRLRQELRSGIANFKQANLLDQTTHAGKLEELPARSPTNNFNERSDPLGAAVIDPQPNKKLPCGVSAYHLCDHWITPPTFAARLRSFPILRTVGFQRHCPEFHRVRRHTIHRFLFQGRRQLHLVRKDHHRRSHRFVPLRSCADLPSSPNLRSLRHRGFFPRRDRLHPARPVSILRRKRKRASNRMKSSRPSCFAGGRSRINVPCEVVDWPLPHNHVPN